jgi:transcriptional regulator with XRE-family HTH domain
MTRWLQLTLTPLVSGLITRTSPFGVEDLGLVLVELSMVEERCHAVLEILACIPVTDVATHYWCPDNRYIPGSPVATRAVWPANQMGQTRSPLGCVAKFGNTRYHPLMTGEETVAGLLRRLRREQGRSLRAVSADLGVAPSYLSRLERGERRTTPEIAQRMADYYDVPSETIGLIRGQIPEDIVAILQDHPEEFYRLRQLYGSQRSEGPDDIDK